MSAADLGCVADGGEQPNEGHPLPGRQTLNILLSFAQLEREVRALIDRFQAMIRTKVETDLDPWIADAAASLKAAALRACERRSKSTSLRR